MSMRRPFYKQMNAELTSEPLENWKNYFRFHVADQYAPFLSSSFVQENFEFYRKYLRGAKEMQPRWKRCVQYADYNLGEALGQVYVRQGVFAGTEGKHAGYGEPHRKRLWESASSNLTG